MEEKKLDRRSILKGAATSSLAAISLSGGVVAGQEIDQDEAESLQGITEIKALQREYPQLDIQTNKTKLIGTSEDGVSIREKSEWVGVMPTNRGTLILHNNGSDMEANILLDKFYSDIDADWPKGTNARLMATGTEVVFQREATSKEKHKVVSSLDILDKYDYDDIRVSLAPSRNTYYAIYASPEVAALNSLTLRETPDSIDAFDVVNHKSTSADQMKEQFANSTNVTIQSCDCNDTAADTLLCLHSIGACASCFVGGVPAPPVGIACVLLSCFGGSGVLLEVLADAGCTSLDLGCAENCVTGWVDQYV